MAETLLDWADRLPVLSHDEALLLLEGCGVSRSEAEAALKAMHPQGGAIGMREFCEWLFGPQSEKPSETELRSLRCASAEVADIARRYPGNKQVKAAMNEFSLQLIGKPTVQENRLHMAAAILRTASLRDIQGRLLKSNGERTKGVVDKMKENSLREMHYIHLDLRAEEMEKGAVVAKDRESATLARFEEMRTSLQAELAPDILRDLSLYDDAFNKLNDDDLHDLRHELEPLISQANERLQKLGGTLQQRQVEDEDKGSIHCPERLLVEAGSNSGFSMEIAARIAKESGGFFRKGPLKKMRRMIDKTEEDNDGNYLLLCDVDRSSIEFRDLKQMQVAVASIRELVKEGHLEVLRVKHRLDRNFDARTLSGGYRDILMNYRLPRGLHSEHVSELQLHLEDFLRVKAGGGHKTYTAGRALHILDPATTAHFGRIHGGVVDQVMAGLIMEVHLDCTKLDADILVKCLRSGTSRVEILSLQGCALDDATVARIVGACGESSVLRRLDLSGVDGIQRGKLTTLPWEGLAKLWRLEDLKFMNNEIRGPIPALFFESMQNLRSLQFQNNPIGGPFPEGFKHMQRLKVLRARECSFHGVIPEDVYLQGLRNLQWVAINVNAGLETASVTKFISSLRRLEYSDMSGFVVDQHQRKRCEDAAPEMCRFQWTRGEYWQKYPAPDGWLTDQEVRAEPKFAAYAQKLPRR